MYLNLCNEKGLLLTKIPRFIAVYFFGSPLTKKYERIWVNFRARAEFPPHTVPVGTGAGALHTFYPPLADPFLPPAPTKLGLRRVTISSF